MVLRICEIFVRVASFCAHISIQCIGPPIVCPLLIPISSNSQQRRVGLWQTRASKRGDGYFVRQFLGPAQRTQTQFTLDLNLPLTGIAFVLVLRFLSVHQPEGSVRSKLARVDWM
jgi:hypothetical protein